jgi:hypothetical protein
MRGAPRRLAALLVLVVASGGTLATNLAYASLGGEWVDTVTLGPDTPAVLRRLVVTISAEALPETEGLLSGGTYGPVSAHFPAVDGLQVALIGGAGGRPSFEAAGEHVLLDAASCQLQQICRRSLDVVISLPDATEAVEVEWSVRGGVYVPGGELPAGAELSVGGMDGEAIPVAVHELAVDLDGRARVDPDRPLRIWVGYTPTVGTQLRLHQLAFEVTYDGAQRSGDDPAEAALIVARRGGERDQQAVPAGESASVELKPLDGCLARCRARYSVTIGPSADAAGSAGTATWRVRGWAFVLGDPVGEPPAFDVTARRPPR